MGLNNKHTLQSGTIVLVTGAAGFIGFHVSQALLEKGCVVIGYDNCNDYYDVSLKEGRLGVLSAYPEFTFIKGDLADKEALDSVFTTYDPTLSVPATTSTNSTGIAEKGFQGLIS